MFILQGCSYAYDPCGRPFTTMPIKMPGKESDGLVNMLDLLLKQITEKVNDFKFVFKYICCYISHYFFEYIILYLYIHS